jgi:hypothetical protein
VRSWTPLGKESEPGVAKAFAWAALAGWVWIASIVEIWLPENRNGEQAVDAEQVDCWR